MRKKALRSVAFVWAPLVCVAGLDHFTGPHVSMLLLYTFPVAYAVMRMGIRGGLLATFVAGAATFASEMLGGMGWSLAGWNALTDVVVLTLLSSLLHTTSKVTTE